VKDKTSKTLKNGKENINKVARIKATLLCLLQKIWSNLKYFFLGTKSRIVVSTISLCVFIGFMFCLPNPLFNDPVSLVVNSREGKLLGARIAKDGQWRFPENPKISPKFETCITTFEDKRFTNHFGVDFLALVRAVKLNFQKGTKASGASTITMQTIRLARKGKRRTYFEKITEIILALRLEIRCTKSEILSLYCSYAPFGGNVVGLDAAAWKYFGRPPLLLTWAENATLAVLPNSPSLIHLSKNRLLLKKKRDFLLRKLMQAKLITAQEYQLSLLETLPAEPKALPNITPHLLDRFFLSNSQKAPTKQFTTTIDFNLQEKVNNEIRLYGQQLVRNGVCNAGIIVLDVTTNHVLAYAGNTPPTIGSRDNAVDMVKAMRSTGSILKPFLYAFALEEGEILPNSVLQDVPSNYAGFAPKNYERSYEGVVKASDALARSLNVPMVKLLSDYGQARFYNQLRQIGMSSLTNKASHYGLSLILGGAETSLWDISAMYSGLVRSVQDFNTQRYYRKNTFETPQLILDTSKTYTFNQKNNIISASSAFFTLDAMNEVKRPGVEASWQSFISTRKIAWKTGTSYGNRDAWAIGCTQKYVVAVWVGNSDGEGRPEMTGTNTASPLLFHIFNLLPKSQSWFSSPKQDLEKIEICSQSGFLASTNCPKTTTTQAPKYARKGVMCPYCRIIHLDNEGKNQVNSNCYSPLEMQSKKVFALPPTESYYYTRINPYYQNLPEFLIECQSESETSAMHLVYPKLKSNIYLPITLEGSLNKAIFQLNHQNPSALVYWHLDEEFIGTTTNIHEMSLSPNNGEHTLTLVDEYGERLIRKFKVERGGK
jgi:penicillin-binding protein 1C